MSAIETIINCARWCDDEAARQLASGNRKDAARLQRQAEKLWARIFGEGQ